MRIIFLALLLSFNFASAQEWKPRNFATLNVFEQNLIQYLSPMNEANKSFVQLLLDMGTYKDCVMETRLEAGKVLLQLFDQKSSQKYFYTLQANQSLVSFDSILGQDHTVYVLVFDQASEQGPETLFMYFNLDDSGTAKSAQIYSKGEKGQKYYLTCTGK